MKEDGLIDLLLQGKPISHLLVEKTEDIEKYLEHQSELLKENTTFVTEVDERLSVEEFHKQRINDWMIPEMYKHIDVRTWLLSRCDTDVERGRIDEEFVLFEERGFIMLLRCFIYLVDVMREHGVIWGVGRGSSVNSYILYKIGVHRVDSLKYGLDIKDYLK